MTAIHAQRMLYVGGVLGEVIFELGWGSGGYIRYDW